MNGAHHIRIFVVGLCFGAVLLMGAGPAHAGIYWSELTKFSFGASLHLERNAVDDTPKLILKLPVASEIDSREPKREMATCVLELSTPPRSAVVANGSSCLGGRLQVTGILREHHAGQDDIGAVEEGSFWLRITDLFLVVPDAHGGESKMIFHTGAFEIGEGETIEDTPKLEGKVTYKRGNFVSGREREPNMVSTWLNQSLVVGRAVYVGAELPLLTVDGDDLLQVQTIKCGRMISKGDDWNREIAPSNFFGKFADSFRGSFYEMNLCNSFGSHLSMDVSNKGKGYMNSLRREERVNLKFRIFADQIDNRYARDLPEFWQLNAELSIADHRTSSSDNAMVIADEFIGLVDHRTWRWKMKPRHHGSGM